MGRLSKLKIGIGVPAFVGLTAGVLAGLGWRYTVPRLSVDAAPPPLPPGTTYIMRLNYYEYAGGPSWWPAVLLAIVGLVIGIFAGLAGMAFGGHRKSSLRSDVHLTLSAAAVAGMMAGLCGAAMAQWKTPSIGVINASGPKPENYEEGAGFSGLQGAPPFWEISSTWVWFPIIGTIFGVCAAAVLLFAVGGMGRRSSWLLSGLTALTTAVVVIGVVAAIVARQSSHEPTIDLGDLPVGLACAVERDPDSHDDTTKAPTPDLTATTAVVETISDGRIRVQVNFLVPTPGFSLVTRPDGYTVRSQYLIHLQLNKDDDRGVVIVNALQGLAYHYSHTLSEDDPIDVPPEAVKVDIAPQHITVELDTRALAFEEDVTLRPYLKVRTYDNYPDGRPVPNATQFCR